MDASRRNMFKQVFSGRSLRMLSILIPGSLERLLDIGDDSRGSAEEAGLALGRRIRNKSSKLTWNTSSAKCSEDKTTASEDSDSRGGDA